MPVSCRDVLANHDVSGPASNTQSYREIHLLSVRSLTQMVLTSTLTNCFVLTKRAFVYSAIVFVFHLQPKNINGTNV